MPKHRYTFGALTINTGNLFELDSWLREWLANPSRNSGQVGFLNPHVYNCAEGDPEVRFFLQSCDLVCVDGIGIVLAYRLLFGRRPPPRVVATALFDHALSWQKPSINALLIGCTPDQAQRAAETINSRNGAWRIVRAIHGYLDADAYPAILAQYSGVDAVLVGAGSPKSEQILRHARQICPTALCWHIGGGTIGIYAGSKARAPAWVAVIGLEWLHRFILEPHYRVRVYPGIIQFIVHLLRIRFFLNKQA